MELMKIGVLSPNMGFISGYKSMHLWASVFINEYCSDILTYEECKTYDGDIIVQLNGRPDLPNNCPPVEFKGLKAVHLYDHVFQSKNTLETLKKHEIDYLMCYNNHDVHDSFFKEMYSEYIGKVIPIPFGYNDLRFKDIKPFSERENKVIALGSVNPVSDKLCLSDIKEYAEFYKNEEFTHKWRRMLWEKKNRLIGQMDSLLPAYPKTKDFSYDIVQKYNDYTMFTSGESIMNYPSVKTFEGMACGSVLVCSDHLCYKELGLIDGKNCIMHRQYDLENFQAVVFYYQNNEEELEQIARNGRKFVEEFYNPKIIAKNLFINLQKCIEKTYH